MNKVRIIGGVYRGRKLSFPDQEGLRPTPDRVRETLFNWLQGRIEGARCLDLFAGSGALGLEALSRGAAFVHFVDSSSRVMRSLRDQVKMLGCMDGVSLSQVKANKFLREAQPEAFDLVFLDPPYADKLLSETVSSLNSEQWLRPDALVYIEQDAHHEWVEMPANWQLHREGQAGQAAFRLMKFQTQTPIDHPVN